MAVTLAVLSPKQVNWVTLGVTLTVNGVGALISTTVDVSQPPLSFDHTVYIPASKLAKVDTSEYVPYVG